MIQGELNKAQLAALKAALDAIDLPPKKQQRLLWRIAKLGIITAAKRNARNQTDPDGQPWEKRKRGKKKMLRQLPKLLHVKEMPEIKAVRIYLQGGKYQNAGKPVSAGLIGAVHQNGARVQGNASTAPRARDQDKPANPRQARKLRKLGYQVWRGKRYAKASAQEIMAKMTMAQAGLMIRKLSGKPSKQTWKIDIPARVFLGVNDEEFNRILARQLQAIGFGVA